MDDIQQGSIELENEKLDLEDLEQAYEEGVDDDAAENNGDDQQQGPDMDGSMGGMGAAGGQVPQMPQQQMPGGMM
jgi:hypothetical protein